MEKCTFLCYSNILLKLSPLEKYIASIRSISRSSSSSNYYHYFEIETHYIVQDNLKHEIAIHITNSAILNVRCSSIGIFKKFLGSYIFMFLFIMVDTFSSITY